MKNIPSMDEFLGEAQASQDLFDRIIHQLGDCTDVKTAPKTLTFTRGSRQWMLRLRSNAVNIKEGPISLELSGHIDDVIDGTIALIRGYQE